MDRSDNEATMGEWEKATMDECTCGRDTLFRLEKKYPRTTFVICTCGDGTLRCVGCGADHCCLTGCCKQKNECNTNAKALIIGRRTR